MVCDGGRETGLNRIRARAAPSNLPAPGDPNPTCAMPLPTLDHLRRHAVARSLRTPTTLPQALKRLGFVQADPLRAPARAQDLVLRLRVADYRAGDLERRYPKLAIEEDFLVNYGFVPRSVHALMHPRTAREVWPAARWAQAQDVLAFVRERGEVHPREVDVEFAQGRVLNWFGGSTRATTELLDGMHYRGLLRIARRSAGTRVYAAREPTLPPADGDESRQRFDALVDLILRLYAPLPAATLGQLTRLLLGGVPQWRDDRAGAVQRVRARHPLARIDGIDWLWPDGENPRSSRHAFDDDVRLLAPFDPIVWDRRRFEHFWGWAYRFEAYTPAARRTLGHYALPLLWRGQVVGWGNLAWRAGRLHATFGWVAGHAPREPEFRRGLDEELGRMSVFLADPMR
jgi:uncharacterized protein YcaQ